MVYTESYRNFAFNLTYKASKHLAKKLLVTIGGI